MAYKLTEADRACLAAARREVESGREWTVCGALTIAAAALGIGYAESRGLRDAIAASLGSSWYVTGWLRAKDPKLLEALRAEYPKEKWQVVYRLAWIDHMLEKGEV